MELQERIDIAVEAHNSGYNCGQAIIKAYLDVLDEDASTMIKASYGLGSGIAMTREICGVISGAALLIGAKFGKDEADLPLKKHIYDIIAKFSKDFEEEYGAVRCGELLGMFKTDKKIKTDHCNNKIAFGVMLLENIMLQDNS